MILRIGGATTAFFLILSPDPYVSDATSTQAFNRYSYALNNPLRYTDQSGEFIGTILTASLRLPLAIMEGGIIPAIKGFSDSQRAKEISKDAWNDYRKRVKNAYKIDMGLFRVDSEMSFGEKAFTLFSRFTREMPQTWFGNILSHFRNNVWRVNVDYYREATLVNRNQGGSPSGMTLGSYITGLDITANPHESTTFAHEYGHVKQSRFLGGLYLPVVGFPSLIGSFFSYELRITNHDREWCRW